MIRLLSSSSRPLLTAPLNHQAYAARHGYGYLFDVTPYPCATPYDQKIHAILAALEQMPPDSWLVWVDDDCYFMQLDTGWEGFLPEGVLAICRSPVNPEGGWSAINSGVMVIRAGATAEKLFRAALDTPFADVVAWWRDDVHGPVRIDGGDQERLLYQIEALGLTDQVTIHDHGAFNARAYHFHNRPDEHFICHMASHRDKSVPVRELRARFPELDASLLPAGASTASPWSMFATGTEQTALASPAPEQGPGVDDPPGGWPRRIGREVRRVGRGLRALAGRISSSRG